jgi:hypothetical protein
MGGYVSVVAADGAAAAAYGFQGESGLDAMLRLYLGGGGRIAASSIAAHAWRNYAFYRCWMI